MNSFETAARFDVLAISIIAGSLVLLAFFAWVLLDRREYADPMERRRRDRAARLPGTPAPSSSEAHGADEEAGRRRPA